MIRRNKGGLAKLLHLYIFFANNEFNISTNYNCLMKIHYKMYFGVVQCYLSIHCTFIFKTTHFFRGHWKCLTLFLILVFWNRTEPSSKPCTVYLYKCNEVLDSPRLFIDRTSFQTSFCISFSFFASQKLSTLF